MTFRGQREDMPVQISTPSAHALGSRGPQSQTKKSSLFADWTLAYPNGLPRKFMVVGYFAELKGLVGCKERTGRAFKLPH